MVIALQMRSWKYFAVCVVLIFGVTVQSKRIVQGEEEMGKFLISDAVESDIKAMVDVNGDGKVDDAETKRAFEYGNSDPDPQGRAGTKTDPADSAKTKPFPSVLKRTVVTSIGSTTAQTSLSVDGNLQGEPVTVTMKEGMTSASAEMVPLIEFFKKVQLEGGIDAIVFMSTWCFLMSQFEYTPAGGASPPNATVKSYLAGKFGPYIENEKKPRMIAAKQFSEPGIKMEDVHDAQENGVFDAYADIKGKPAVRDYAKAFLEINIAPKKVFLFKALDGKDVGPANGVARRSLENHKDNITVIFEAGGSQIKLCKIYLSVDANGVFKTVGDNMVLTTAATDWTLEEKDHWEVDYDVGEAKAAIKKVQEEEGRKMSYNLFVSGGHKKKRKKAQAIADQVAGELKNAFGLAELEVHHDEGALEALSAVRGLKEVYEQIQ